jgi:hypothetical protein
MLWIRDVFTILGQRYFDEGNDRPKILGHCYYEAVIMLGIYRAD